MTLAQRFSRKVNQRGPNECWPWEGGTCNGGYGVFQMGEKKQLAHRCAFFFSTGHWPEMNILHECDNPICVNPAHLKQGTQSQNMVDAARRQRMATGERAYNAKLKDADVFRIRQMWPNLGYSEIARRFNVSSGVIRNVILNIRWRWVKPPVGQLELLSI